MKSSEWLLTVLAQRQCLLYSTVITVCDTHRAMQCSYVRTENSPSSNTRCCDSKVYLYRHTVYTGRYAEMNMFVYVSYIVVLFVSCVSVTVNFNNKICCLNVKKKPAPFQIITIFFSDFCLLCLLCM